MLRALMAVLPMVALSGCTAASRSQFSRDVAQSLVSDAQEAELGREVREELSKQGVRYVEDAEIVRYVENLSLPILRAAGAHRQNVQWKVSVIDDLKTVNAFATPGGYLYVYTGLIAAAENEAELAGVMGHEAAHVTARHSARQLVNAFGLQAVIGLALGENPKLLAQIGAMVAAKGMLLANSRADETEADEWGMGYAYEAGFDPHGIAWFFQKLQKSEGRTPEILTWLSTHPAPEQRVEHIQALIDKKGLSAGKTDSPEFQRIKAKVQSAGNR